jgi:hypothetical protein
MVETRKKGVTRIRRGIRSPNVFHVHTIQGATCDNKMSSSYEYPKSKYVRTCCSNNKSQLLLRQAAYTIPSDTYQ